MRRLTDRTWWRTSIVPLLVGAALCLLIGLPTGAYFVTRNTNQVDTLAQQTYRVCLNGNESRDSIRQVFIRFELALLTQQEDPARRRATIKFFDSALIPLKHRHCLKGGP